MRIKLADANARAIEGENKAKADVVASQAALQVKQAEAYQLGETRKARPRPPCSSPAPCHGQGRDRRGPAGRGPAPRRVGSPGQGRKGPRSIVDAEAEAEKRRIEAEGQASAIFAKLDAEARGQFQILAKKGEGLKQIIDACGGAEQAFQMMMLEHFDHLVEASAQAISNIKFDKVVVWEGGGKDGHSATAKWLQDMARTLPPMMQVMKDIGGVEIPDTLARFSSLDTGLKNGNGPLPAEAKKG